MSKQTTTDFDSKLFNILMDYGDFFLTDYPKQAEKKSIHPTIARLKSAVSELVKECIGEDDKIKSYTRAGTPCDDCVRSYAYFEERNKLRAEIRQRFKERGIEIK